MNYRIHFRIFGNYLKTIIHAFDKFCSETKNSFFVPAGSIAEINISLFSENERQLHRLPKILSLTIFQDTPCFGFSSIASKR